MCLIHGWAHKRCPLHWCAFLMVCCYKKGQTTCSLLNGAAWGKWWCADNGAHTQLRAECAIHVRSLLQFVENVAYNNENVTNNLANDQIWHRLWNILTVYDMPKSLLNEFEKGKVRNRVEGCIRDQVYDFDTLKVYCILGTNQSRLRLWNCELIYSDLETS